MTGLTPEATAPNPAGRTRVGFVGLGTMGSAMAANLARAGFPLTVFNRTPGRAGALVELGAAEAASPGQVAAASDVVVTCVPDSPQVAEVLFGPEGLVHGFAAGSLFIDCSTISPARAREFGARLADAGVGMVDAPVSGGSEGAKAGTLTIMVGGEATDVERARPVLGAMGRTITHLGPLGSGQVAKAVNQVVLCGTYLGVAEGIVLAMKAGLDPEAVVAALAGGAAGSWVLQNRSKPMIEDRYPLGFRIALHRKDLAIALELSRHVGAVLPVAALAATLEDGLIATGHGDDDNSALARAVRRLSGM
ncbi:MAG: NAD(P)-dependent oxidoreductase [Acidimicrobiales bacterium]